MLKPFLPVYGTSTSYSVRDGLLPVHPLVLGLPATLRASTLTMMMRYTELAKRPSNDVLLSLTTPAASLASRPRWGHPEPHVAYAPPAAVAHSLTPVVEEAHHEARYGNLNPGGGEGTWGTTTGQEQVGGQGQGGLQTIPPHVTGAPDLACKMRPRHAARVQTAARRDTNGHTAERHRRQYGREPPNRPHTDTLAHGHARAQKSPRSYGRDTHVGERTA